MTKRGDYASRQTDANHTAYIGLLENLDIKSFSPIPTVFQKPSRNVPGPTEKTAPNKLLEGLLETFWELPEL